MLPKASVVTPVIRAKTSLQPVSIVKNQDDEYQRTLKTMRIERE